LVLRSCAAAAREKQTIALDHGIRQSSGTKATGAARFGFSLALLQLPPYIRT